MKTFDQRARGLGAVDAVAVACVLALTIMGCAGGILNASLYARVAQYCGIAREVSTLVGSLLFLAVFLVSTRKPSLLDRRLLTTVALGCALTAAFVLEFGLYAKNGPLSMAGFLFSNAASAWSAVLVACSLSSLRSSKTALFAVVCGMALGEVVRVVHPPVSFAEGIVEIELLYACIIVMLYRPGGAQLDKIARSVSPARLELSNPESFLRPAHALFLCVGVFSVATGYGLTLNEVAHAPISVDISAVVLVGAAVWMLVSKSAGKEDQLFSFAVLLVVAGFIIAPFTFLTDLPSTNALLRIGVRCFDMLVWLVVLAVGRRNLLALLPTYALVRCMMSLGTDVGAVAGHTTNDIVGTNGDAAILISEAVLFAFVAFLWLGFRRFSFTDTICGVVGVNGEANVESAAVNGLPTPGPSIEERCARLGEAHGLTERETEIFALLARGRNGQFVMEHYVVSRNTVKSHVKHIYAKLDVHSQQELIDLVEHS